ncbi:MAG: metalloregulator ArsR/SmtB family transcription factor [Candidatus Nanopelagicales bacterium]
MDRIFHALADATRRDIVRRALVEEHSVSAIARQHPMSVTAIQKHVAVLERAGLVTRHRHGREQLVRARIEGVEAAQAFLDQYEQMWRSRIERFGQLLADPDSGDSP